MGRCQIKIIVWLYILEVSFNLNIFSDSVSKYDKKRNPFGETLIIYLSVPCATDQIQGPEIRGP